mgnify:CR=1 FL=1
MKESAFTPGAEAEAPYLSRISACLEAVCAEVKQGSMTQETSMEMAIFLFVILIVYGPDSFF